MDAINKYDPSYTGKARRVAGAISRMATMTKPFTGADIMTPLTEGCLSHWDPVEEYLPEFRDMWLVESREGDARLMGFGTR